MNLQEAIAERDQLEAEIKWLERATDGKEVHDRAPKSIYDPLKELILIRRKRLDTLRKALDGVVLVV